MKFDTSILREADIRGIYPTQVSGEFATRLGQVFGTYVLKQDKNTPYKVEDQIIIIYAVIHNLLKEIPVSDVKRFEKDLIEYVNIKYSDLLENISKTGKLEDENSTKLEGAIKEFKDKFLNVVKD